MLDVLSGVIGFMGCYGNLTDMLCYARKVLGPFL